MIGRVTVTTGTHTASAQRGPDSGADWSFFGECVDVSQKKADVLLDE